MESYKSSVDKFFDSEDLSRWATATRANAGDLIFVMAGTQLSHPNPTKCATHGELPSKWDWKNLKSLPPFG